MSLYWWQMTTTEVPGKLQANALIGSHQLTAAVVSTRLCVCVLAIADIRLIFERSTACGLHQHPMTLYYAVKRLWHTFKGPDLDAAKRRATAEEIVRDLTQHTAAEQEVLYPTLREMDGLKDQV